MKIDLNKEILDRNGQKITAKIKVPHVKELEDGEVVEEQVHKAVILNLGKALRDCVLTIHTTAGDLKDKLERYQLFLKIEKDEEVELSEEEINKLKNYVADRYEVIFCGQIVDMLS